MLDWNTPTLPNFLTVFARSLQTRINQRVITLTHASFLPVALGINDRSFGLNRFNEDRVIVVTAQH